MLEKEYFWNDHFPVIIECGLYLLNITTIRAQYEGHKVQADMIPPNSNAWNICALTYLLIVTRFCSEQLRNGWASEITMQCKIKFCQFTHEKLYQAWHNGTWLASEAQVKCHLMEIYQSHLLPCFLKRHVSVGHVTLVAIIGTPVLVPCL